MRPLRTPILMVAAVAALSAPAMCWGGPAEDQFEVASRQYEQGQYKLAATEFADFLKSYPNHASAAYAQFFLAESLVQLGEFAQARPHFDGFHTQHPDDGFAPRALFRRGEAAYLTGDLAAAREHLGAFRQNHPTDSLNAFALPYLGDLALQANQPAEAQQHYAAALREHGATTSGDECRFGLAKALHLQRRYDDAERFYKFLIDKENSPWADDALLQLGQMQLERGDADAALATLGELTAAHAQSDVIPYARYWIGVASAAKEDWPAAIAALEPIAGGDPADPLWPAAQYQLGEALRRAARSNEATEHFQLVLDRSPTSAWVEKAAYGKLRILSDTDQHTQVQQLAGEFNQKYPASPLTFDVRRMQGRAQLRQDQFAAAVAALTSLVSDLQVLRSKTGEEGAALSRSEIDALLRSSRYLLGLAHVGNKQYEQALTVATQIQANPDEEPELAASVSALRASALAGLGRSADLIEPLETYLRLTPAGADANHSRAQLAIAYAQAGRFDDAQRIYNDLAEKHDDRRQFLEATHLLAERAFTAGEKAWARELFATLAADDNPAEMRELGLSGKAWTELDLNAPLRSAETFERLLKDFPNSPLVPEAAIARAAALEQLQQQDAALAMYALVIEKYPESKQLSTALYRAASVHDGLKQNVQAAELFARYVKEFPQQPNLDAALYRWAWVLKELGRTQEAVAAFARLHQEHPRSYYWADATFRLAQQAAADSDYERVAELTNTIADSGNKDDILAHALYLQGRTAARAGRWNDAIAPMQQLAAQFPSSPLRLSADYWVAEATYRLDKLEEADPRFAQLARDVEGRQRETWMAMIPLRRALMMAQQRKWAAAYATATTIAEDFPGFSQQHEVDLLLGRCLAKQAKFSDAREKFQAAIDSPHGRRSETAAMAQWHIGETYFHQKDYENAIRAYSRVELLYDQPRWQAAALLQAGKCYEFLGQWDDAARSYTKVVSEFADTTFKEEASQRLKVAQQKAGTPVRPGGGLDVGAPPAAIDARTPERIESR